MFFFIGMHTSEKDFGVEGYHTCTRCGLPGACQTRSVTPPWIRILPCISDERRQRRRPERAVIKGGTI